MKLVLKQQPNINAFKATLDNIEELKTLINKGDTIELLNYTSNKYYNTKEEDGDYYVIKEIGAFQAVLGYIHLPIGWWLVNRDGQLYRKTEEELFKYYKING